MSMSSFPRRDVLKGFGAGAAALAFGLPHRAMSQAAGAAPLRAAVLGSMANLHPWHVTNIEASGMINLLYSNLVRTMPDGTIAPDVAVALPKITNNGLTYTFELRQDVTFHNGDKLTSRDVLYTWEQFQKTARRKDNFTAFIREVVAEGDYVVRFELKRPNSGFLYSLSYEGGIVRVGTDVTSNTPGTPNLYLGNNDAGSGPFTLTKYEPDAVAEFQAYPGYFGGKPAQEKIVVTRIPDPSAQLAAILSGSIDIASTVPPKDFGPAMQQAGIKGGQRPSTGIFYSPLNRNIAPFNNVHLRKAFACAIDRDFICNDIYYGLVTPTSIPATPDEFWYDAALAKELSYDPDKARFHLKEGGMPDGFKFEAMIPSPSTYIEVTDAAVVMQANLADVGITMDIRQIDFTSMYNAARAGDFFAFPNASMQFSIEDYLIYNSYACAGSQFNFHQHCVADYDAAVLDSFREVDPEAKKPHLKKVLQHLVDDSTSIWIGRLNTFNLWREDVSGFEPSKLYQLDLSRARKA